MLTAAQIFVQYALSIGAIELIPEGRKLKSGRISPYFFNSGLFCSGESRTHLAYAYATVIRWGIRDNFPEVLFGPAYKGTFLAPAVAMCMHKEGISIGFTTNRKEVKTHGEGGDFIGALLKNTSVVIVDDVITTGDTKLEAMEFVGEHGGKVIAVVVAFDRQETVGDTKKSALQLFEEKSGVPVFAAATLEDLIAVLEQDQDFPQCTPDTLTAIESYRERYGVK